MRPVLTNQQLLDAGKSLEDKYRYTRPDANWELRDTRGPGGTPVRIKLTGDQAFATLPEHADWQAENPGKTILNRYRYPEHPDNNTGYRAGQYLSNLLGGDNAWKRQIAGGRLRGGSRGRSGGFGRGRYTRITGGRRSTGPASPGGERHGRGTSREVGEKPGSPVGCRRFSRRGLRGTPTDEETRILPGYHPGYPTGPRIVFPGEGPVDSSG